MKLAMVEKNFSVVTVTVITRWVPPVQAVVTADVQSLTGDVDENVPVSLAHWHNRAAVAVTPVMLTAAVAVLSIVAVLPL